jgi:hypothetical protein
MDKSELEVKAAKAYNRYIVALRLNKDLDVIFALEDKYKTLEKRAAEARN